MRATVEVDLEGYYCDVEWAHMHVSTKIKVGKVKVKGTADNEPKTKMEGTTLRRSSQRDVATCSLGTVEMQDQ